MTRLFKPMGSGITATAFTAALILSAMLLGCNERKNNVEGAKQADLNLMEESRLLRLYDNGQYYLTEVVNPWDTIRLLGRYILVERGSEPDSLPAGEFTRIDIPLQRSIAYSSVHTGIIGEMGKIDAIAGVADARYFTGETADRIKRGLITDIGPSMAPSIEAIVALRPDAILVSPFENAGHGVIAQAGAAIIECADYMESTPKGRAEWVKFFGLLYGSEKGDSIYKAVAERYDSIASLVANAAEKPLVLTEMLTDGYWFVPGGKSYMAEMIADAGATYPWRNDTSTGSLQLDFSSVYAKAADADFWLIRSYGKDLTLNDIKSVYLLNCQFKAFKNGNVFVANTAEVPLFEEFPFHPDLLLEEYVRIFHPGTIEGSRRYFKKAD